MVNGDPKRRVVLEVADDHVTTAWTAPMAGPSRRGTGWCLETFEAAHLVRWVGK